MTAPSRLSARFPTKFEGWAGSLGIAGEEGDAVVPVAEEDPGAGVERAGAVDLDDDVEVGAGVPPELQPGQRRSLHAGVEGRLEREDRRPGHRARVDDTGIIRRDPAPAAPEQVEHELAA